MHKITDEGMGGARMCLKTFEIQGWVPRLEKLGTIVLTAEAGICLRIELDWRI